VANPTNRFSTAIESLLEKRLEDIHVAIPAVVEAVNYDTGYIQAKPLLKARYSLSKFIEYPSIGDIPPLFLNDGFDAFVTMPIKVGATVVIHFSERDPASALESDGSSPTVSDFSKVLGMYPIGWSTTSTLPRAKAFSPTDIVIENDLVKINITPNSVNITNGQGTVTLAEDGTITQVNTNAQTVVDESGSVSISNANGSITLSPDGSMSLVGAGASITTATDGTITMNGLTITSDGNIITAAGVNLNTHVHSGVQAGGDNSGPPV
jgi:hypothetical protein